MPLTIKNNNQQQQKQLQVPKPQQMQNPVSSQKSPYQQNVANVQPQQNNSWFKGTYPTTNEILGRVYQIGQKDPNTASQIMAGFSQAQQDSSSPWYNPYMQATNQAVNVLQSYGIDTNMLTDEWFQNNTAWQQSLRYGSTTNTPQAPLKNATPEQIVAFNLYQYQYSEPTTKKAEQEWAALQQELTYKATRKDRNYSDDDIINSIDWNKYQTLKAMNDGKTKGAVTELNRAVNFSDDSMRGVLWAARNGGSSGNIVKDMAMYGLGEGNKWVEDPEMRAKLAWGNPETYSPYQVGMTLDEEVGMYFNVPYIDRQTLNHLRATIDDSDKTSMSMFNRAAKSVDNAEKAQEQRDKLYAWIDKNIGNKSEEWLLKNLDVKLGNKDYAMLKAMDESIDNGSDLVQMGTAVDYRKQDVIDYIRRKKAELGGNGTAPDIANGTAGSAKTKEQVQQEAEDIHRRNRIKDQEYTGTEKDAYDSVYGEGAYQRDIAAAESLTSQSQAQKDSDQYVNDTVGDIEDELTPGESSRLNGYSGASDQAQQTVKANKDAMVSGEESPDAIIQKNNEEITKGWIEGTVDIYPRTIKYEQTQANLDFAKKQIEDINAKLGDKVFAGQTQDTSFTMEINGDLYRITLSPDLSEIEGIDNVNKADTPVPVYASFGLYDSPEEYDADTQVWDAVEKSGQVEAFREKYAQETEKINAANKLEITDKDRELMKLKRQYEIQVEDNEQYLRDYKNQYDADIAVFKRLSERRAAHIQNLKDMGASTTEVETADAALTALTGFTSYEATQWDYYNPSYAYADKIEKGEDRNTVLQLAEAEHEEMLEQIKDIEWLKGYCDRHNIEIGNDVRRNMDRRIAKIQRDTQDYEYFRLQFSDDFDKVAEEQRKIDEKISSEYIASHVMNDTHLPQGTLFYDFNGYDRYLTDDEKNTWYYLKAKDEQNGTNKAEEYAKFMTDDTYGVLMTRAAMGIEEGAKALTGQAGTVTLGFAAGNITAVLLSPYTAVASGIYRIKTLFTGEEMSPNSRYLQTTKFRSAVREQSAQEILETFGKPIVDEKTGEVTGYDSNLLSKGVQMFYEMLSNRADSMINAASFGWMFGGIGNNVLRELLSASPMGMSAGMEAAARAKERGATDAQASAIGFCTFLAETGTEAVSLENMSKAFEIGEITGPGSYKQFLVNWLTKAGISEMVGESTNDIVENLADEWIMGELSEHAETVYQYRLAGMSPNEAELAARKDEVRGVLRTALMSYLTPGLDVFQTMRGRMGYFSEATDKLNAENPDNKLTVRQVRKQIIEEERSEARKQREENQKQKEEAKGPAREPGEIDYDALEERYAPEKTEEAKAAEEEAKTAEEEAKVKEGKQNTVDFEILETAKTYDKAGKSAAIAAVLDEGSTQEETDTANAASVRLDKIMGPNADPSSELQDLLLGAKVADGNIPTSSIKQGIMYSALGGEQSQSRQVMQSDEYQKATPAVKATMLAEAAQQDAQNPDVVKNVANAVREDRIAKQMGVLMANGAAEKIGQAEVKVDFAKLETQKAQKGLDTQRGIEKTAREKQQSMVAESVQNPNNKQMAQDAENAMRDLIDQAKVTREYEQSVKNAQQREDDAVRNAEKVRQKTLSDIRKQAEQYVAQEDQQRAEQRQQAEEALRAEQEKIAKENAERQAAEDQANGKAAEDERRMKIDRQIEKMGLKGEKAEQLRQKLYQFDEDIQTKKVDTSRLLSDAESALAINELSRRLGVQIEVGPLPEGKDGVYRSNGKIVLSDRLTVGQAMLEVAMHEITHSLEKTKSYGKYKDTVMSILFNSDAEREAAIQNKIDFYQSHGVKLGDTPAEVRAAAEAEIVADFAKNDKTFANRATINRMIDSGLAGKIKNALHNVNQYLKNAKLSGQERQKAEALRRAERLYTKAIDERRAMSAHPTSEQFSVNQFAEAAGLFYQEYDITDDKGRVIAKQGLYTADPTVDKTATRISKVTAEMMENTPVGLLTNTALSLGTMDHETVGKIHQMFADLMTMCSDIQDTNLVWEIAGATLYSEFSAIKGNSDKQYSTTVDFGTICTKTQAVINQLSRDMLRLGRGLTSQEILDVYNDVYKSDLTVPCPVCYVFSRWLGVPSLLENIRQYQNRFLGESGKELSKEEIQAKVDEFIKNAHAEYGVGKTEKEQDLYRENVVKLRQKATDAVAKAEEKVHKQEQKVLDYEAKLEQNPTRGDWLRNKASAERNLAKLQEELTQKRQDLENVEIDAYGKTINKKKADIEKSIKDKLVKIEGDDKGKIGINDEIRERIKQKQSYDDLEAKRKKLYGEIDELTAKLREVDAYNWVTQALCKMDADGRFVVDDAFVRTKDDVLLDLTRTGEFAKDTKNWTYRCTRGAGMGKAILPYSGASIGDSVLGVAARRTANPFKDGDTKGAFDAVRKNIIKAKQQNLIGGQRFQSTSDFRAEWGLDYIMTFIEQQALGSNGQLYTKVPEAVPMYASVGIDTNCSIMPYADGFHYPAEGEIEGMSDKEKRSRVITFNDENGKAVTVVLDFSDVTGMKYSDAQPLTEAFDCVQMIMVGINDIHIRACLAGEEIDFVIPWHASGNTKGQLTSMMSTVSETLTNSSDYTKVQTDQIAAKKELETAHGKQERGEELTARERDLVHKEEMRDAREKLLTGKKLTSRDRQRIAESKYLTSLYERFEGKTLDGRELPHDSKYWVELPDGKGKTVTQRVTLTTGQAEQIFPYEYWDTSLKKEDADQNGLRFIEYCQELGLVPRFSGGNQKDEKTGAITKFGNFSGAVYDENGEIVGYDPDKMAKGYWKVLIDRKMYDNNGNYRDQQQIDATKLKTGQIRDGKLVDSTIPAETAGATYRGEEAESKYQNADRLLKSRIEEKAKSGDEKTRVQAEADLKQMQIWDTAHADIEEQYDLAGQDNPDMELTQGEMMQMLKDAGVDYADAVARDDMEAAQADVDWMAEQAGFSTEDAFHGTDSFGFTEFDMNASQGEIFVAYSKDVASTYTSNKEVRAIPDQKEIKRIENLPAQELVEEYQKAKADVYESTSMRFVPQQEAEARVYEQKANIVSLLEGTTWTESDKQRVIERLASHYLSNTSESDMMLADSPSDLLKLLLDQIHYGYESSDYYHAPMNAIRYLIGEYDQEGKDYETDLDRFSDAINSASFKHGMIEIESPFTRKYSRGKPFTVDLDRAREVLIQRAKGSEGGIYRFYTRPGKQLVINAYGKKWNGITGDIIIDATGNDAEAAKDFDEGVRYSTRQISSWARNHGYDSVRINNVYDNGGIDSKRSEGFGNIGIFFNQKDVKSADPVTYDDDGKVIPLDQRFSDSPDIRWSVRGAGEMTAGQQMQAIDDALDDMSLDEWFALLGRDSDESEKVKGRETWTIAVKDIKDEFDPTIYGGKLYLKPETLEHWLSGSGYAASKPNYSKAYLTTMNPADFLRMTTASESEQQRRLDETKPLNQQGNSLDENALHQPIMLFIDEETGRIVGHEGRHRSIALARAGVTEIPVFLYEDKTRDGGKQYHKYMTFTGQSQVPNVDNGNIITFTDVTPVSAENHDELMRRFTASDEERQAAEQNQQRILQYSVSDTEGELSDGEMMQLLTDAGVYDEQYSVSEPTGETVYDRDQQLVKDGILTQSQLRKMNKTDVGEGTRQWGTGMAQSMDELADQARQFVLDHSAYQRDTNKAQIDRAVAWVKKLPTLGGETIYDKAVRYVTSETFRKGESKTADGRAKLAVTMGMAVARNDVSAQVLIADMTNKTATNIGQALQAQKLFKLMTPEGRIETLQRMLDDQKVALQRRGKNAVAENLKFSDWVIRAAGLAETEADQKMVRDAALNELAKQIPMNWKDRINSFRMLSMLANPRTHIRNVVGNALFVPAVGMKNKLAAIAEAMTLEKGERTKTLAPILNKSIREFARQDATAMKDVLTGEAKYNESGSLIGRQQKGLSKINGDFLEAEDWLFLKGHYRRALGGWMQANGYTVEDVKNDHQLLEKGRAYAIEEAQKATYRDFSKTADALNKISKQGGALGFVVDAALPFKKTPINILRRGIEYSPVGIAKGLKNLMFHMNEYTEYQKALEAYEAGETTTAPVMPDKAVSPNQVIDQICSGLSGTAVMALGFLLAGCGAVTCGLDDDEDKFDKAKGEQEYSIKLFGTDVSMTIDWAAPMCMPFFVGAAIRDQAEKENLDIEALINAFGGITEPVFNLSMLDGVNTLLKTNSYDKTNPIAQIGSKLALNYAGSFVPSFLGAVARTYDDKQRKAFVPGDQKGVVSNAMYTLEQAQNKVPIWNQQNIAARNIWGEEKTSSFIERLAENFISPGYFNKVEDDPIINEMGRLYDVTGDNKMIPDEDPDKKITFTKDKVKQEVVLTDKQWDEYKRVRGQTAKQELTELINSESYQNASDSAKLQMMKDVWSHADKVGKNAVVSDIEVDNKPVGQIAKESKITGYESEMIKYLNNGDFEDYDNAAEAIRQEYDDDEEADAEIRQKLMNYYREMYKKAYRAGGLEGQTRMNEIEEALEYTGLVDESDFMRWQNAVDNAADN